MVQRAHGYVCLLGCVLMVSGCERSNATPSVSGNAPAPSVAPAPPPPPTRSPLDVMLAIETLPAAIEHVRTQMTDTDDEASPGTVLLGVWAAKHMRWSDVTVEKNETSFALVRKDSDASRGKRMCLRGSIIQIQKENLGAASVFTGLMMSGYSNIVSFLAVGSTGELVQNSGAKFCGVVVGTYDYSNSAGGRGHAISAVGMFDLPENRSAH